MSIDISMRLHINRDKDKTLYAYARVCVRERKAWFDNDWEQSMEYWENEN